MAVLTIPNGRKWNVKLTKHDGEVWFENGWCEFASCHALTMGHLVAFRYEGNSAFSVLVFDATATEIEYPLDDQPQVHSMEDNESDDNSIEIMDAFMPSPVPRKRAKTNPKQARDTHFRPKEPKSKGSMLEKSKMVFGVSFTRGKGSGLAHGVGGNRVGCTSGLLVKLESDCSLDDVSFLDDECPKKDGGVVENLLRANAFRSENPLFTVIIHPSYVNGKDRASLPHAIINYLPREGFSKDCTKGSIVPVKLQVVDQLWPVKLYVYEGKYSSCVISAGWSAFVRENGLQVGDVCVFELSMRDDVVFNIHIFRADLD
ncbi:B3 domain-containing transcription factor VRN1-like [Quercus lobata]|nr:B3 domain-containing transcription factor VRN1-like [Quercus lobata]